MTKAVKAKAKAKERKYFDDYGRLALKIQNAAVNVADDLNALERLGLPKHDAELWQPLNALRKALMLYVWLDDDRLIRGNRKVPLLPPPRNVVA